MPHIPRICLVEPSDSHDEVLFPIVELLREHCSVHVIAPRCLLERDLLRTTGDLYHGWALSENPRSSRLRRAVNLPFKYWQIRKKCRDLRPKAIIFNTTYRGAELWLIRRWFPQGRVLQLVHEFQRFLTPVGVRQFQWFARNLVLSEHVYEYISAHHQPGEKLSYFLPIYFQSFRARSPARPAPWREGEAAFHLGVFGNVDQRRRNYLGLLDSLARFLAGGRIPTFLIHLVGKVPQAFRDAVRTRGLDDVIRMYGFLPFADMFTFSEHLDVVLFLIDATVGDYNAYNRYKITGTSVMLKTFHKVGAASDEFTVDRALEGMVLRHPGARLEVLFEQLADGRISKQQIAEIEGKYQSLPILQFAEQQRRLLEAVNAAGGPR